MTLVSPLPGRISIASATFNEYKTLRRFHYRPGDPRVPADVVAAWHQLPRRPATCVGVAVLAWPTAFHRVRYRALGLADESIGRRIAFANANVRTIARVIVHPTFRAIGLSTRLVRALILRCPTRYVEATAMMGRIHPLFCRAGMRRVNDDNDDEIHPAYYLFDKWLDRLPILAPMLAPSRDDEKLYCNSINSDQDDS
jgi:GNAT superfamily N-acetyltransferase